MEEFESGGGTEVDTLPGEDTEKVPSDFLRGPAAARRWGPGGCRRCGVNLQSVTNFETARHLALDELPGPSLVDEVTPVTCLALVAPSCLPPRKGSAAPQLPGRGAATAQCGAAKSPTDLWQFRRGHRTSRRSLHSKLHSKTTRQHKSYVGVDTPESS